MINKHRLIKTFIKLVKIDSLSLREGKIAAFLTKELKNSGVRSRVVGQIAGGEVGNLIAEVPGNGIGSPRLLLNAHMDTVTPGKNIRPVIRKGYIQSSGSTILGADNKAGVAAILEILKVLKEKGLKHPPLLVILTAAEEIGLAGAKALPENVLKADMGLTLDGGDIGEIINRAPTQYNISAKIIGRAAHAGMHPEEGINAIKVASEAIAKMKLGRIDKETTANIGVIEGGKATNIIPDEVGLKGEARSHNPKKLERQIKQMKKELQKACRKNKAKLKLKIWRMYGSFEVQKGNPLIRLVSKAIGKPQIVSTGGGSDANIFNGKGIPTILIGVGADRIHTKRERLPIKDFVKGTEIILKIILGAGAWRSLKRKH